MTVAEVAAIRANAPTARSARVFLRVTQERVQDEDDRDHHRVDGPAAGPLDDPDRERGDQRGEQQVDQWAAELRE